MAVRMLYDSLLFALLSLILLVPLLPRVAHFAPSPPSLLCQLLKIIQMLFDLHSFVLRFLRVHQRAMLATQMHSLNE